MTKTPIESAILTIFGITGDLAARKLLPSLYYLFQAELLPKNFAIVGVTRSGTTVDKLIEKIRTSVESDGVSADQAILDHMAKVIRIVEMDLTNAEDYTRLKKELDAVEDSHGVCMNRLFYLAIPAQTFAHIVGLLAHAELNSGCQHGKAESRLLIEKPFGYDLASAQELIEQLNTAFSEEQIYRIDHYLAKETTQNILTFRFANPLFKAAWDNSLVSHIMITAAEKIGIEGRVAFYEQTGALRDLIQSHLFQLMALVTMEEPKELGSDAIHREKLRLLEAVEPIHADKVANIAVRGQYEGYREEVADPHSMTETYAAVRLAIDNDRWRGVPVLLRTGKGLAEKATEITLVFCEKPGAETNSLTFRIQPNEGIVVSLQAKKPGFTDEMQEVQMDFLYRNSFVGIQPDAYQRVLVDALKGDKTLFATSEEVLASWRIVEPILHAWSISKELPTYEIGSWGPSEATNLAHNAHIQWPMDKITKNFMRSM
jgi:glucose-6-phosphate 1-dehydrogenase